MLFLRPIFVLILLCIKKLFKQFMKTCIKKIRKQVLTSIFRKLTKKSFEQVFQDPKSSFEL